MVEYSAVLDRMLTAISDPTRRQILALLAKGPARVTAMAEPCPMSLNAVSKHVQSLEQGGLVRRMRWGREHILELNADPLGGVVHWLHRYSRFWIPRLDRIASFFPPKEKKP